MRPPCQRGNRPPLDAADDELAFVTDDLRRGPVRQLLVWHLHGVAERVGELAEPRPENDRDLGDTCRLGANRAGRFLDFVVVVHQRRNPAIVAVMKLASVPANMARRPRRARSWRRFGARAPMPPIWMPIELRFAKPQSANVAIVNDFGSS